MPSFEQTANRRWSVRFRFVEFGKYKQKRLSGFATKKEADKAYAEFINNNKLYKKSDNANLTFNQLYSKYYEHVSKRLKPSTLYDTEQNFNKHILPVFGSMKIFKISKQDVLKWQKILNESNYKYRFKRKLRGYLSSIIKFAMYYYDLPINPVAQVEPFRNTEAKIEMKIWSLDEFKQFIKSFNDSELTFKVFFSFLYLTGCRKGEAFALTWNDIDFNNKIVNINKNLTRKTLTDKTYGIVATKTGESRRISISDNLICLLKDLYNHSHSNFVFGGEIPLADNTTTRVFKNHIILSKVSPIHIHCLRHSHASLLISNGESIVMVAKRLGHASVEQTLNTYSHLMPNDEQKMLGKLEFSI